MVRSAVVKNNIKDAVGLVDIVQNFVVSMVVMAVVVVRRGSYVRRIK